MSTRGYTVFGWVVWQLASRIAKRKMADSKLKLGAVATVALVLIAGVAAAKASGDHS